MPQSQRAPHSRCEKLFKTQLFIGTGSFQRLLHKDGLFFLVDIVDGSEIRRENQLRDRYPFICKVLYIPGGCLGFLDNHQYHESAEVLFGERLVKRKTTERSS